MFIVIQNFRSLLRVFIIGRCNIVMGVVAAVGTWELSAVEGNSRDRDGV